MSMATIPSHGGVLAVGLSCLDMLLLDAAVPETPEAISEFRGTHYEAGGSAPNVARAAAALGLGAGVRTVVGDDLHGKELQAQIAKHAVDVTGVIVNSNMTTSLSLLPVFPQGRGCFVDLACNAKVTVRDLFPVPPEQPHEPLTETIRRVIQGKYTVFHFGYPHLMKRLQGEELSVLLQAARAAGAVTSIDVNGANSSKPFILQPALHHVGVFHANAEEAAVICGADPLNLNMADIKRFAGQFLSWGAAFVVITLGADGAYLATSSQREVLDKAFGSRAKSLSCNDVLHAHSFQAKGKINATGAGDSFLGGLLGALSQSSAPTLPFLADMGMASALFRIDSDALPTLYDDLRVWVETGDAVRLQPETFI